MVIRFEIKEMDGNAQDGGRSGASVKPRVSPFNRGKL